MFNPAQSAPRPHNNFASCSGCGLCLLVCPVWRQHQDIGLTPLGRARALQHGAVAADIAESIQSCTLCGACEPVCPEDIALVAMTLDLRGQLPPPAAMQDLRPQMDEPMARPPAPRPAASTLLLPGAALRERPATLKRVAALLRNGSNISIEDDDGADIAQAIEAGAPVPTQRLERFLHPLRGPKKLVITDGLMLRQLRQWLPQSKIASLGETLSRLKPVRNALRSGDLYVIEPRAYHADYQRLVKYYDALRIATGCTLNLDLQRIAIPATARSLPQRLGLAVIDDKVQTAWILRERKVTRIVVESIEDGAAFEQVSDCPVVHLADLADDGTS